MICFKSRLDGIRSLIRVGVAAGLCSLLLLALTGQSHAVEGADLILINGPVYTVNPDQPWAEAVAVSGDTITYVGDQETALTLNGPDTELIDLQGQMLLPGFGDSHLHLLWGGRILIGCDLGQAETPEAIVTDLTRCERRQQSEPGAWLVAGNWARSAFPDGVPPPGFLDELFPKRPVSINAADGHTLWVNQEALRRANITDATLNPRDGVIERDPVSGKATGMLSASAMELVIQAVPSPSPAKEREALSAAIKLAHQHGITAAIEPGLDLPMSQVFSDLNAREPINLRLLLAMAPGGVAVESFGDEIYVQIGAHLKQSKPYMDTHSVKFFVDGVVENATASLLGSYLGGRRNPEPFYSLHELSQHFIRLDDMGISIHVHAIGDRGVRRTLDAFEILRAERGVSGNRHVITHLQLIDDADRGRFAELDISASFSLLWAYVDDYSLEIYPPLVDTHLIYGSYPAASLQREGARIAGASDWSVTSLNPLLAIETGITRRDPWVNDAPALNASEGLDLATMIRAYTLAVAWLMKNENNTGSIEAGKKADLVVLEKNLFEIPVQAISDVQISRTIFAGKTVYEREESP